MTVGINGTNRDQLKLKKKSLSATLNGKMCIQKIITHTMPLHSLVFIFIFVENIMTLLLSLYVVVVVVNGGVCLWYCVGLCASIQLVKPF